MEVELRTGGGEVEERFWTVLNAQLDRVSRHAPQNAKITIELHGHSDAGSKTTHVADLKLELSKGDLEASESASTMERAIKLAAGNLTVQLKAQGKDPGHVTEYPRATPLDLQATVREYWLERASRHTHDSYAGVRLAKFPEDLRVYEHLIWASRPTAVIEIGTFRGGSALWFRDRLRTLADYGHIVRPLVISIDLDLEGAREDIGTADPAYEETITMLQRDVADPDLPDEVASLLPADARCLVVEDSAHTFGTTTAALRGFARFVALRGFFVVEDGSVDHEEMRVRADWPRGVLPAVREWLKTAEGRKFRTRRDLEIYGMTSHPEGFLQRIAP